jgi:hypothetical protein
MGQDTKANKMVVGEFKWKRSHGRPRCILEDNTEVDLREITSDCVNYRMNWVRNGPKGGFCEQCNEVLGSNKTGTVQSDA